jgi:hypothetical protein
MSVTNRISAEGVSKNKEAQKDGQRHQVDMRHDVMGSPQNRLIV